MADECESGVTDSPKKGMKVFKRVGVDGWIQ
jgi:hypothetical protein